MQIETTLEALKSKSVQIITSCRHCFRGGLTPEEHRLNDEDRKKGYIAPGLLSLSPA
jgi:hypothetical protein